MADAPEPDVQVARTFLEIQAQLPAGTETIVTIVHGKPSDADGVRGYRVLLSDTLADTFRRLAVEYAAKLSRAELVSYDPGRELVDGEASFRPTDALPAALQLMSFLGNPFALPPYSPQVMKEERPSFYVVSLRERGPYKDRVHYVRRLDSRYRIQRSRLLAMIPLQDGSYQELKEEPLLLAQDFDAMVGSELVVVTNQRNVDTIFGVLDEVRVIARAALKEITVNLRIDNYTEFESAVVGDLNMLSKLRSIRALAADTRYSDAMTMEKIAQFASDHPHMEIDVIGNKGSEKLVFHSTAQRRWRLLRLLDDQFVRSLITDLDYEANSKSRLA